MEVHEGLISRRQMKLKVRDTFSQPTYSNRRYL